MTRKRVPLPLNHRITILFSVVGWLLFTAGCDTRDPAIIEAPPKPGAPAGIERISGDYWMGGPVRAGQRVPDKALAVRVVDKAGVAVPGAFVQLDLARVSHGLEGLEFLDRQIIASLLTDKSGEAHFRPLLPTVAAEYQLRAVISNGALVTAGAFVVPDSIVDFVLTPRFSTLLFPSNEQRSVLLSAYHVDRFGNRINIPAPAVRFEIDELYCYYPFTCGTAVAELQPRNSKTSFSTAWIVARAPGDAIIVARFGSDVDTAYVQVQSN